MYTEIQLKLTEHDVNALAAGQGVKITKSHCQGKVPISVTNTQLKKLQKVSDGSQGFTLLRLSAAALKRTKQHGGGFWGSVGNFFKNTFTSPSGILGVASMIPTPLSGPLRAASMAAKLTGHGKPKKSAPKARKQLYNVGVYNHPNLDDHHRAVEDVLRGMGFQSHHIQHMKGHGVFSSIRKGVKKLGSFLMPYIRKEGARMIREYGPGVARGAARALNSYLGGSAQRPHYMVKFTKPQLAHIHKEMAGHGIFSDIGSHITQFVGPVPKSKSHLFQKKSTLNPFGGNLMTIGSIR
jgi:hypothetical protein